MERRDVEERLIRALAALAERDSYLLENDLSERCIAARLAMHLQGQFPDYKVDVEYNRAGEIAKRVPLSQQCAKRWNREGEALAVPDIIVHQRGNAGPNVLVLELKKTSNPAGWDCDRERVLAFRTHLNYEFGALIECETRRGEAAGVRVARWLDNDAAV